MSSRKVYKIAALGSADAGKSALVTRFVEDNFPVYYDPTIEENYMKGIDVDDRPCTLDIIDISGQEEFEALISYYIRVSQGFVLAYSITSLKSFNEVLEKYERIAKTKCTRDFPIVLVGNKCDLEDSREVTTEQGEELARELNCPFFEASAKEYIHVEDVFAEVIREVETHCHSEEVKEEKKEKEPEKESKISRVFNFFKGK